MSFKSGLVVIVCTQGKEKGSSLTKGRFRPDLAAMAFHQFTDNCQASTSAATVFFTAIQALEQFEHLVKMSGGNADAVIADVVHDMALGRFREIFTKH